MKTKLDFPTLLRHDKDGVVYFTDDSLFAQNGVKIAFVGKLGGFSEKEFSSLNLGNRVGDDAQRVEKNREKFVSVLSEESAKFNSHPIIINPKQVHKDDLIVIKTRQDAFDIKDKEIEADGVVCDCKVKQVCPLLCFADCVPVIMVTSSGAFAVVHAGWRGVVNKITQKAYSQLLEQTNEDASEINVYIGPHIRSCCFEVGSEVKGDFVSEFGEEVVDTPCDEKNDKAHISMVKALYNQLFEVGAQRERICDLGICTCCSNEKDDLFYSYRKTDGKCGRHGALAFGV